ncbi:MAG: hypothetical protein HONDAALG_03370 [Gammaproteobacteria bacterium]|nr:hypothetical protein [Gammaproteobacteria bacterium]
MIKKDRGDGHLFELAYPNMSLLHARIEFVNAISKCAPEVFERLHGIPLQTYKETGLLRLKRKRRIDFWESCYGGGHLVYYFNGYAPIEKEGPYLPIGNRDQLREAHEAYVRDGATEELRQALLVPGGDRRRIQFHIWQFFSDFGLDYKKDKHIAYYQSEIHPKLIAWMDSLENWADANNLRVGWMLHWAFLKLDSYVDQQERPYESPIYREMRFPIVDIFGKEIQPPIIHKAFIFELNLHDFWIEPLEFASDLWRPLVQSEEEFERRVRDDFEIALKRYLIDSKRYLDLRPDLKRVWGKTELSHYEWLARFQCKKERIADIASTVGEQRTRSTVKDAIDDVAEFIGLPLRPPDPAGRRPGTKDKKPRKTSKNRRTTGRK